MNYYLIANNRSMSRQILKSIASDQDSCLILYNFLYPINIYPDLLQHKNIIYISRQVTSFLDKYQKNIKNIFPYAGMLLAKKYEVFFQKILFHSSPLYLSEPRKTIYRNFIDQMNFNTKKLGMMEPYSLSIRNKINYPLGKSMSTGIISYVYLKNIITANDSIFLAGFNHNISKKHHNHNFEKDFFSSEINNKKCKVL